MRHLLEPVCWIFGHKKVDLTINSRYSGRTHCDRCTAAWWRGSRVR